MGQAFFSRRTIFLTKDEQASYGIKNLVLPAQKLATRRAELLPVDVQEMWYEDRLDSDWVVAYRLALEDESRIIVSEIRIFPAAPPREPKKVAGRWIGEVLGGKAPAPLGGIKAKKVLRRVRLRRYQREMTRILKAFQPSWKIRDRQQPVSGKKRGPKPKYHERHYAKIAVAYDQHHQTGMGREVAAVARAMRLEPGVARAHIRQARQLVLLTDAPRQGEAGGVATPRAKALAQSRH